jgi:hypothetical protein
MGCPARVGLVSIWMQDKAVGSGTRRCHCVASSEIHGQVEGVSGLMALAGRPFQMNDVSVEPYELQISVPWLP